MAHTGEVDDPLMTHALGPVAPRWGWRHRGAGRSWSTPARRYAVHHGAGWRGCTRSWPGPAAPPPGSRSGGTRWGRSRVPGPVRSGWPPGWSPTPACSCSASPGVGKSALAKRLTLGMAAFGGRPIILGDTKGEHTAIITALGGQVIRVGRGWTGSTPWTPARWARPRAQLARDGRGHAPWRSAAGG